MKVHINSLVSSIESQDIEVNETDLISTLNEKLQDNSLTFVLGFANLKKTDEKSSYFSKLKFLKGDKTFVDYEITENANITILKQLSKEKEKEDEDTSIKTELPANLKEKFSLHHK